MTGRTDKQSGGKQNTIPPASLDMQRCKNKNINPLIATLKPQSNGPSYSNTVTGTLVVDGWPVTIGTVRKGLSRATAHPGPPHCTKCNSPPINGQCTNFVLFNVAL